MAAARESKTDLSTFRDLREIIVRDSDERIGLRQIEAIEPARMLRLIDIEEHPAGYRNPDCSSLPSLAAWYGRYQIFAAMCRLVGADRCFAWNMGGYGPLHIAATRCQLKFVQNCFSKSPPFKSVDPDVQRDIERCSRVQLGQRTRYTGTPLMNIIENPFYRSQEEFRTLGCIALFLRSHGAQIQSSLDVYQANLLFLCLCMASEDFPRHVDMFFEEYKLHERSDVGGRFARGRIIPIAPPASINAAQENGHGLNHLRHVPDQLQLARCYTDAIRAIQRRDMNTLFSALTVHKAYNGEQSVVGEFQKLVPLARPERAAQLGWNRVVSYETSWGRGETGSLLAAAIHHQWIPGILMLLEFGADPNGVDTWTEDHDKRGTRLVHLAAQLGNPAVLVALVRFGANVSALDKHGNPISFYLSQQDHGAAQWLNFSEYVGHEDFQKMLRTTGRGHWTALDFTVGKRDPSDDKGELLNPDAAAFLIEQGVPLSQMMWLPLFFRKIPRDVFDLIWWDDFKRSDPRTQELFAEALQRAGITLTPGAHKKDSYFRRKSMLA
jgi:hypothetical protein